MKSTQEAPASLVSPRWLLTESENANDTNLIFLHKFKQHRILRSIMAYTDIPSPMKERNKPMREDSVFREANTIHNLTNKGASMICKTKRKGIDHKPSLEDWIDLFHHVHNNH